MKIIHVIDAIDPALGGPPGVVIRLGAAQASLGHEVHIVSYGDDASTARVEAACAAVPNAAALHIHIIPNANNVERVFPRAARAVLEEVLSGGDFVHLHGVWESILLAAATLARRRGIPYAICPHGMLDTWSLMQKANKKRMALRLGRRAMLDKAAFIHALNEDEIDLMGPPGLLAPKTVLPNGIFIEEVEPLPPKGTFQRQYPALDGRRFVLFMSRLHHKKGLDVLAAAFERIAPLHPDVDLVVVGPDAGAREAFELAISAAGLNTRVHLPGPLYGAAKIAALVDAACFCLPSRQEGFSLAITEALACGTPVVISKNCHFPEVGQAGAGTITPLNAAAVASALNGILSDPALAYRMGDAGRVLVKAAYTWPQIAARSLAAYRDFSKSPRAQNTRSAPSVAASAEELAR